MEFSVGYVVEVLLCSVIYNFYLPVHYANKGIIVTNIVQPYCKYME